MIIDPRAFGLHPDDIRTMVQLLDQGKVGILPTDSVFAFCGRMDKKEAFESICRIKHLDPRDAMMSMVCRDLRQASEWFTQWDTPTYRILNRNLPGPFTFILSSGQRVPAHLRNKKKTLGLRIPNHPVLQSILAALDAPLIVSSVRQEDDILEYFTDMTELIDSYEKQVAFLVADDEMIQEASTVVDLTGDEPVILRQSSFELQA